MSLRSQFPFKLSIGSEDATHLLADGFTFSNVDPGGFEMASFAIPRDMPEAIRGQPVRLDCGLGVAWEGRISGVQRSLGNRTAITCEGYGARAKDEEAAMIFVDRDMTQWQGPSLAQQIAVAGLGTSASGGPSTGVNPADGTAALVLGAQAPWSATNQPFIEALYDARGLPLSNLYYGYALVPGSPPGGGQIDTTDTNWAWSAQLSVDDVFTTFDNTGNLRSHGSSFTNFLATAAVNRVFANLRMTYGAAKTSSELAQLFWENLAVYGYTPTAMSGRRPSGVFTGPYGFYPSDIVGWVVAQIPGLQPGTIQTTDGTKYIVPHSAYYDPVTLDTMLNDMAVAGAWNWSVWEAPGALVNPDQRPRLDFQPRPADGTWHAFAWRHQCDTLDIHEDLNGLYDTAIVSYSQADGSSRSVVATSSNPYLDATGIGRGAGGPGRVVPLNAGTLGGVGTGGGATLAADVARAFGVACLGLLMQQARLSGSITITTQIQDATGGPKAAWMLHAGQHRIRVPDLPSTDYAGAHNDLPITRVECSISKDAISTSLEIGQGANLVETLQARVTTAQQLVGL